jgi:ubiquinone/menaquinone biosynthesis C-methylase UbiE
MSYSNVELREHPSTYFVQDRENLEEMTRLELQDKMLTTAMGGVLPEFRDHSFLRRVLDVGCGTGGWLIETALTYPTIEQLFGGDISAKILSCARAKAEAEHLGERVQFRTMDALRALEFRDFSFDLVNQRLGTSWLRTWEWTKILLEYHRVVRPGGIIRITESAVVESNSPALTALCCIVLDVLYHSGCFFTRSNDGIIGKLPHLMAQHAIEDVKTREYILVFKAGTVEHQSFYEDMRLLFRVALPHFQKWVRVPSNYEEIYQQALKEMLQPDFVATWHLLTAWGTRARDGRIIRMRGLR